MRCVSKSARISLALAEARGVAVGVPWVRAPGTQVSPASEYAKGSVTGTVISMALFLKVAVAVAVHSTTWLVATPKSTGSFTTMSLNLGPMRASWGT